jgi:excisionase family DNA binding protein
MIKRPPYDIDLAASNPPPSGSTMLPAVVQVDILFTDEVARLLRCTSTTVRRMAKAGQIPSIRIGGVLRFRADDVAALLRSQLANRVRPQADH